MTGYISTDPRQMVITNRTDQVVKVIFQLDKQKNTISITRYQDAKQR